MSVAAALFVGEAEGWLLAPLSVRTALGSDSDSDGSMSSEPSPLGSSAPSSRPSDGGQCSAAEPSEVASAPSKPSCGREGSWLPDG